MASLQDCLQDVIAQGEGYFIRSSTSVGAHGNREWESTALLADLRRDSPGLLQDHAWLEWSHLPDGSHVGAIHYGVAGASLGYQEVPGYGRLRALDQSQRRPISTGDSSDAAGPLDGLLLGPSPDRRRPTGGTAAAGSGLVPQGRPRPGHAGPMGHPTGGSTMGSFTTAGREERARVRAEEGERAMGEATGLIRAQFEDPKAWARLAFTTSSGEKTIYHFDAFGPTLADRRRVLVNHYHAGPDLWEAVLGD